MDKDVTNRKCRICGASYNMRSNPKYKKWTCELKYINEDGKHRYYSNMFTDCCPTCVAAGKNIERR